MKNDRLERLLSIIITMCAVLATATFMYKQLFADGASRSRSPELVDGWERFMETCSNRPSSLAHSAATAASQAKSWIVVRGK